eukprot:NODE_43_length_33755_cov_1.178542.p17 type:complete len:261 gc:universal NODE_43_length_33755_cov_1.178542:15800-16582(+)
MIRGRKLKYIWITIPIFSALLYVDRTRTTFRSTKLFNKDIKTNYLEFRIKEPVKAKKIPFYYVVKEPNIQAIRQYTPIILKNDFLQFFVKLYPKSLMGRYLCNVEEMQFKGPYIHPQLESIGIEKCIENNENILCIAGGTGILPFYQLLQKYGEASLDLFYCSSDDFLKKELGSFANVRYFNPANPLNLHSSSNLKKYKYILICGPERLTHELAGYDNDEFYSLDGLYRQEHNLPIDVPLKPLRGKLKELGLNDEQVVVL